MMTDGKLVVEADTNIENLIDLLDRAKLKAKELDTLINEINNFEVELNINKEPKVVVMEGK